jgi:hypothetical protein
MGWFSKQPKVGFAPQSVAHPVFAAGDPRLASYAPGLRDTGHAPLGSIEATNLMVATLIFATRPRRGDVQG